MQFVRLNWLIIIYLPAVTVITMGFAAMSRPESLGFLDAPMSAPHGACTGSSVGWIINGFRPGQCAGVAFGRIGLIVAGIVVTLVMVAVNQSIKWRVPYLMDTAGRRRYMRNERRAWEFAHRNQSNTQLNEIQREIAALKNDLKAHPRFSGEAARIRGELQQLRSEFGSKFRASLHDIHTYRKGRRNERRQKRTQWHFKYWLDQHSGYTAELNSITPNINDKGNSEATANKTRKPKGRSLPASPQSVSSSAPKITKGPVKRRSSFKSCYAFRYCVEHWTKHYDIYVYIHHDAPKRIMKTAGRAALETVLKRGEAPNRIFIDSSGKIITEPFASGWDPR
jgi:hypothetical protein